MTVWLSLSHLNRRISTCGDGNGSINFVAGVTNGYLFYTPTVEQFKNRGGAQEDSDSLVAPEWQALFESKADEIRGAAVKPTSSLGD